MTLIGYLTKYITKRDIDFYRLPSHCSHNVSKLFTSQHIEDEDSAESFKECSELLVELQED